MFSDEEKNQMVKDAAKISTLGVDGIVFGALLFDLQIDFDFLRKVREVTGSISLTFHKAFDQTIGDIPDLMKSLSEVGVSRVLSSGRKNTALEGVEVLREMIKCGAPIVIVAGSVRSHNFLEIFRKTHAAEIHSRSPEICGIQII